MGEGLVNELGSKVYSKCDYTFTISKCGSHSLSRVLQDSISGPVLLNAINDLDTGLEDTQSTFVDNSKLRGAVDFLKSRQAMQRDLDNKDGWEIIDHIKFNKSDSAPGERQHWLDVQTGRQGTTKQPCGKGSGVLADRKLNMNQQCTIAAERPNHTMRVHQI